MYNLPNCICIYQAENDRKGGSVCIYAHNSLVFFKKENLSMNCDDLEAFVIEIDNAKGQECNFQPWLHVPKRINWNISWILKLLWDKTRISNKNMVLIG